MKRQLRQFANFLMKNGYDGDMSKLRSSAKRFWLANIARMNKDASGMGQEKGYSNYRVLADSYKARLS